MQTYYLNIWFGESHPYCVDAESLDQAIQMAFHHLKSYADFTEYKWVDSSGGKCRIYANENYNTPDENWPKVYSLDVWKSQYPRVDILGYNWIASEELLEASHINTDLNNWSFLEDIAVRLKMGEVPVAMGDMIKLQETEPFYL